MSESSSCCGGEQQQPPPPPPPAEITEDHSVISAYDYCDYENSGLLCNTSTASNNKEEVRCNSTSSMTCDRRDYGEDVVYDPELDVGYRMDPGFCLRESRIEIAGGREIFSKSRSKPSKKRHSEEVMYHRQRVSHDHSQVGCNSNTSSKSQDFKRFSADVMYDDKLRRYMYNMCSGSVDKLHTCSKYRTDSSYIVEEKSPEHMPRMNGRMCLRKSSSVRGLQDLHADSKQHTGHLVYEAPVTNAEIVYDDIGELIDQRKSENSATSNSFAGNGSSNGLHVKTSVSETDYPTYSGDILESPNSDTDQSFRIMHKPYIGTLDVSSPVSPCGGLWGVDSLGQENVGSIPNLSQEEEMDTDSEPASPVKQGIARLIGNVPIAEYEGSPRRYGPRPGYPHRVSSENVEQNNSEKAHPSTCEELLKVIAGNKSLSNDSHKNNAHCKNSDEPVDCNNHETDVKNVLKEFGSSSHSKNDRDSCNSKGVPSAQDSDFSELEYRLYRVNTGSSYVGRRLAQASGGENQDSPKRNEVVKLVNGDVPHIAKSSLATNDCLSPSRDSANPSPPSPPPSDDTVGNPSASAVFLPNEQELMLLHESVHQHTLQVEMVDQDLESISTYPGTEDLGETEVGEQVDHTRNFTLSPETTDCDSNDVESVVSLEGSMNSGGRLMSSMPVLEDGLSSGHSSDPDTSDDERSEGGWSENRKRSSEEFENPTIALINKQISKIEQDFCKRPQTTNSVPPEKLNHNGVAEYIWRHSCNSQHLTLQDVDLSYFDALSKYSY